MYEPVSVEDVSRALQELNTALPKFGLSPENLPATVRIYRSGLTDFDRETLDGAVKMILRTRDHFPTLKLVRETCREWLRHNRIQVEWKGEEDRDGHTITCRRCKSYGRLAVMLRVDGVEYRRMIAPCDPDRHSPGDLVVPMPENFVRWASADEDDALAGGQPA